MILLVDSYRFKYPSANEDLIAHDRKLTRDGSIRFFFFFFWGGGVAILGVGQFSQIKVLLRRILLKIPCHGSHEKKIKKSLLLSKQVLF